MENLKDITEKGVENFHIICINTCTDYNEVNDSGQVPQFCEVRFYVDRYIITSRSSSFDALFTV